MGDLVIAGLSPASLSAANGRRPENTGAKASTVLVPNQLSPEQQAEVRQLQTVDSAVRQHEQAQVAVAGAYAHGGASYSYTTGPDGKRYATAGGAILDTIPENTPQATIQKMEAVKRAAIAPPNPTSQDRAVYAQAERVESEAQQELIQESRKAQRGFGPAGGIGQNLNLAA